jgi:malate/lactate dehydrogenase
VVVESEQRVAVVSNFDFAVADIVAVETLVVVAQPVDTMVVAAQSVSNRDHRRQIVVAGKLLVKFGLGSKTQMNNKKKDIKLEFKNNHD